MYQTTKKRASGPKCPVTGKRIQGVCSVYYFLPFHIPFEELGIKDQWFILKDMIYILEKWYRERSAVFILLAAPNSHALCCGWICLYCVLLNGWHGKFSGLFFIFASILIGCLIDSKIKVFFFFFCCGYVYICMNMLWGYRGIGCGNDDIELLFLWFISVIGTERVLFMCHKRSHGCYNSLVLLLFFGSTNS